MLSSRCPLLAATLLALLLPAALGAAAAPPAPWESTPFAAPAAEVLAAAEKAGPPGEGGVLVLLAERSFTIDEQGRESVTSRLVYKLGPQGAHESWSTVGQGWAPWYQEKPVLRARVVTPDGAVHALDPATLTESGTAAQSAEMFDDNRVLRGPLPAAGPGAVVEEEATVRGTAPLLAGGGTVHTFLAALDVPVRQARLTIELPAGMPLHHVTRLLPEGAPREEVAGGRRRLTFEYRDLEPLPDAEPGLPPEVPRGRTVAFATGASWSELARLYSGIVDEKIRGAELSPFLKAAGEAPSQTERIDRILAKLHRDVRYTGLEVGLGSIVPRTPAETLARRYGDCKDKAALLTALLRAADIPAYVALLSVGDGRDIEESLPGFGDFDHAIVYVPGSPALWIDPTDPFSRAGELPDGDQGRLALVASPSSAGLLRTPEAPSAANRQVDAHEIELAELGTARMVLTTELSGSFEREIRSVLAAGSAAEESFRKGAEEVFANVYLAKKLDKFDHGDPRDLARPFHLRFEARRAGRGATELEQAVVGIPIGIAVSRLPDDIRGEEEESEPGAAASPRQHDYLLPVAFIYEARFRAVPPAGFVPRELPPTRTLELGPATLTEEYTAGPDGVVTATIRFDSVKRRYTPAELAALRAGLRELGEAPNPVLWWDQKGEKLLAAGDVRGALTELRGLAAAAPAKALPHARLARALLAGGMGEAAREEARRAVAMEPGSAAAHAALGWVLQHDLLGRRFAEGWDRAAALAAYRKARQLDPEDWVVWGDFAILLEYSPAGVRYGPGSELDAAVAEYRALREAAELTGFDDNLAIALLRAGHTEEMRKFLDGIEKTDSHQALRLVSTSLLAGPESALREAAQLFPDSAGRVSGLRSAAGVLIQLRRYKEAAALLGQAGRLSSDAAALLAQADLLAKTRRHEELDLPRDQPAAVARRMFLLGTSDSRPEDVSALLSHAILKEVDAANMRTAIASALGVLGDGSTSPDVIMDVALAGLRDTVEGDEAGGWRVRFEAMGEEGAKQTALLAREGGEIRIVAFSTMLGGAGLEALHHLEAGDSAGARRWLDWAREHADEPEAGEPLGDSAFAVLWTKGGEAGAEEIRCAAAALAVEDFHHADLAPVLRRCRDSAAEPRRKAALEQALVDEDIAAKRWEDALAAGRRIEALLPGSATAFNIQALALSQLRRWEALESAAAARLAAKTDDLAALRTLCDVANRRNDYAKQEELAGRLTALGKTYSTVYNNLAWSALFRDRVEERDIERAQRAASLDGYKNAANLHTLAALYAETGKTAEAYKVILQALAVKGGKPQPHDWYIFGRIAEDYGLPDAARAYYAKVTTEDDARTDPTSTWALAQRRLTGLGRR